MTSPLIPPYWRVPQTPVIVGLSGYARSGKDTVAQILVEKAGFERITFAGKLKESVRAFDPIISHFLYWQWRWPFLSIQPIYLSDAIAAGLTEDEIKAKYPEYRRSCQRMGSEVGREVYNENFWVDIAFANVQPGGRYVITDARFPNEYDAVKQKLGQMWRIKRDGFGPINDHPSETSLDNHPFDEWIENNEGLDYLELQIDRIIKERRWLA